MKFTRLEIPDVILIEPDVYQDPRGWFFEGYHRAALAKNGIGEEFVQDNFSRSARGALRGLHYQIPPKAQAKLGRALRGKVFDVAVDLRKNSKTFGCSVGTVLSGENKRMIYIPRGFAHGFLVLEDDTDFLYKVSDFYSPEHERGILWNDPELKIAWPEVKAEILLSEKDKHHPLFCQAACF